MARERQRPGFSRRAQYSIFTGYVLAVLGALAGLALLIYAIVRPGSFAGLRTAASEIAAPVGEGSGGLRRGAGRFYEVVSAYVQAGAQNVALRREVEAARARRVEMQGVADENRRLKALLGLVEQDHGRVTAAHLIGSTATSTRRIATLSAGWRNGVRAPMPVRTATGLVGRVLEVGPTTSRVLLITDSENVVPVRRSTDGVAAFSTGRPDGRLVLRLINLGINPLRRGDVFLTSGAGGLYPPSVPVAVVESLTRDGAIARLVQDPAAAEFVVIEPVFQQLPPPSPSSSPAPQQSPEVQ
jgi:rod shape-determining protein MreC